MIKPYTFTVDDFSVMVEAGLFHNQRVELLDGVITDMSPAGPHEFAIDKLTSQLAYIFFGCAFVHVQNAIDIELSAWLPHPDVVLAAESDTSVTHPLATPPKLIVYESRTDRHRDDEPWGAEKPR